MRSWRRRKINNNYTFPRKYTHTHARTHVSTYTCTNSTDYSVLVKWIFTGYLVFSSYPSNSPKIGRLVFTDCFRIFLQRVSPYPRNGASLGSLSLHNITGEGKRRIETQVCNSKKISRDFLSEMNNFRICSFDCYYYFVRKINAT
jgi:hypothetical protein